MNVSRGPAVCGQGRTTCSYIRAEHSHALYRTCAMDQGRVFKIMDDKQKIAVDTDKADGRESDMEGFINIHNYFNT